MAKINPEAIREYQEAHRLDTGAEISYEEAAARANDLLELMCVLAQPIPQAEKLLQSWRTQELPPPPKASLSPNP